MTAGTTTGTPKERANAKRFDALKAQISKLLVDLLPRPAWEESGDALDFAAYTLTNAYLNLHCRTNPGVLPPRGRYFPQELAPPFQRAWDVSLQQIGLTDTEARLVLSGVDFP